MTPSEEVRKLLDERGIKYTIDDSEDYEITEWQGPYNLWWQFVYDPYEEAPYGELRLLDTGGSTHLTPAQAIAATLGEGKAKAHPWGYERDTGFFDETRCECGELNDISARYCNQCGREIQIDMSVIEYAEDWYTPQHVCKVNADGTLTSLRDGKTYVDAATLGRSCESCPEMDNPDSYIRHLQSALKWHDEHVPRPTNPRNTCVVLQGSKPPEEVLFVHDEGGVTHYLPDDAGTCDGSFHESKDE